MREWLKEADPAMPAFVLLATDPQAPSLTYEWAFRRLQEIREGKRPESDLALVHVAEKCADEMMEYRAKHQSVSGEIG